MPAISRFYVLEKKLPSLPMSVCTTVKVHLDISLWWFILIIFLHFWSALEIKKLLKFNRKLLKIYKHLSLSYLPSTWGFRSETEDYVSSSIQASNVRKYTIFPPPTKCIKSIHIPVTLSSGFVQYTTIRTKFTTFRRKVGLF